MLCYYIHFSCDFNDEWDNSIQFLVYYSVLTKYAASEHKLYNLVDIWEDLSPLEALVRFKTPLG